MNISPARIWRNRVPRYRLVGGECQKCGKRHFPPRPKCPYCGAKDVKQVELPRRGRVESFTVLYNVPEGHRDSSPAIIASIILDDGTRVVAPLVDIDPSEAKTNMRVEAVFRRLSVDGDYGLIVYGIKFRPVMDGSRGGEDRAGESG